MKCHDCRNWKHHNPGTFLGVAEGNDDPYNYDYCAKFHWSGDPVGDEDTVGDYWEDCKDFHTLDDRY
jgi:hypothetical protein